MARNKGYITGSIFAGIIVVSLLIKFFPPLFMNILNKF